MPAVRIINDVFVFRSTSNYYYAIMGGFSSTNAVVLDEADFQENGFRKIAGVYDELFFDNEQIKLDNLL
ncbi:hypothetical protein [Virgibacillus sp. DJP39]|uniref:hypothetical protein n=1 Tax=Virgibacillus sp. DJP39 TaxID=3409790 RepID=UPI003BB5DDE2